MHPLAGESHETYHDLPSSINVGVEQTENVLQRQGIVFDQLKALGNHRSRAKIHLERDVGLRGSENRRPGERDKACQLISVPKLRADSRLAFQVRGRLSQRDWDRGTCVLFRVGCVVASERAEQ
jgi:hypothetical protein